VEIHPFKFCNLTTWPERGSHAIVYPTHIELSFLGTEKKNNEEICFLGQLPETVGSQFKGTERKGVKPLRQRMRQEENIKPP
jgi:hypothetical protein